MFDIEDRTKNLIRGSFVARNVNMSFDPIPDEVWEDWKWFVCPEDCLLGMREGDHRINDVDLVLRPCYVVNVPKLIMSEVMWSSRLESSSVGIVDTGSYFREVRIGAEALLDSLIFMLSQHPMVISRRTREKDARRLAEALDQEELVLVNHGSGAEQDLEMNDLEVGFFNPYAEGSKEQPELIGVIAAEACIKELSMAKAGMPDPVIMDVIERSMVELERRGMVEMTDGIVVRMTPKGKTVLDVEPVHDSFSCRCEVEPSGR